MSSHLNNICDSCDSVASAYFFWLIGSVGLVFCQFAVLYGQIKVAVGFLRPRNFRRIENDLTDFDIEAMESTYESRQVANVQRRGVEDLLEDSGEWDAFSNSHSDRSSHSSV